MAENSSGNGGVKAFASVMVIAAALGGMVSIIKPLNMQVQQLTEGLSDQRAATDAIVAKLKDDLTLSFQRDTDEFDNRIDRLENETFREGGQARHLEILEKRIDKIEDKIWK